MYNLFRKLTQNYKNLGSNIYILFIIRIISNMGAFVYPLLSLILTQKIHLSKAQSGLFILILSISTVPSLLIGGKLADRYEKKKVILISQICGAICYFTCAFIPTSMIMAVIIRSASILYSVANPAIDALSADLTTNENRKSAFSLLYLGTNIGTIIAPIIGGFLFKKRLSLLFLGDAITTLIGLTLLVIFIKGPQIETVAVSSDQKSTAETSNNKSVIAILLEKPILIYFALTMFIYQFAYSQWTFTLPLQLEDYFENNGAQIYGLLSGFNGFVVLFSTPLLAFTLRKVKPLKSIVYGGIMYIIAFIMFGLSDQNMYLYFVAVFIFSAGLVSITTNSGPFIANNSPAAYRGRINSIIPIITGAGSAVGPFITGIILEISSYKVWWFTISLIIVIGLILMNLLNRKDMMS